MRVCACAVRTGGSGVVSWLKMGLHWGDVAAANLGRLPWGGSCGARHDAVRHLATLRRLLAERGVVFFAWRLPWGGSWRSAALLCLPSGDLAVASGGARRCFLCHSATLRWLLAERGVALFVWRWILVGRLHELCGSMRPLRSILLNWGFHFPAFHQKTKEGLLFGKTLLFIHWESCADAFFPFTLLWAAISSSRDRGATLLAPCRESRAGT
jgi:hypothetical protein